MATPNLTPLTAGAVTGTGTIVLTGDLFGGAVVNTDGTNSATVVIRNENASGTILADISGPNPPPFIAPVKAASGSIYYSISGTNADAMLYEWVYRTAADYHRRNQ